MRFLVGRARRAKRGKGMFDGELTSFWNSLQQAEQRIEAEATEAERNLYRTVYGYKSRVMRLRAALAASGPLARQAVARKLEGIKLDAIWDILFSAVRDMALYYGGSVVLGTAVGAGLGSLAGGVGAIPGAALGFEAGNLLGEWVMMFLGLKMLAEGLANTIPTALRLYVQGFRLAWGPVEGDRPDARYSADYQHGESMAAHRFADGHVLMIMGILIAMVAYLLRGKSEEALMQAVRKSERLGTKMADWLAENKEKLLKEESLKPKAAERASSQEKELDPLTKRRNAPDQSKKPAGSNLADVWKLRPTERGKVIESYLADTEYSDANGWYHIGAENNGYFPLVDFQQGNTLVSLKTVNTNGASWMGDMENHIDDLAYNGATVDGQPANMVLDLRVQPGGAQDAAPLVQYGQQQGVTVVIKEFP